MGMNTNTFSRFARPINDYCTVYSHVKICYIYDCRTASSVQTFKPIKMSPKPYPPFSLSSTQTWNKKSFARYILRFNTRSRLLLDVASMIAEHRVRELGPLTISFIPDKANS